VELTQAATRRRGGGEVSGRRRSVVGKVVRWSPMVMACSCSSKEEGRGEAPFDLKETTRGASSHRGAGRQRVLHLIPPRENGRGCSKAAN
jgi:hypothetical protein